MESPTAVRPSLPPGGLRGGLRRALVAAILTALVRGLAAAPSPEILREFIYDTPAPTPQCHASTVCETQDGIAAAWFGGTRENAPDVGIWFSRREGSGTTGRWSAPVEVFNGLHAEAPGPKGAPRQRRSLLLRDREPCWNPVLFQNHGDHLTLFYKVGPSPSLWWGMQSVSTNGGRTWGAPKQLPVGHLGPIKNKPVRVDDRFLVCPSSTEHLGWRVVFDRHVPGEDLWQIAKPVPDPDDLRGIQPTVLTGRSGRLVALGRTSTGNVFQTTSTDGGQSWSPLARTPLPNPNSGVDAVTLTPGRHVLVYNHTRTNRTPLNVALSTDDAATWSAVHTLEDEPGEYSYPAVIQTRDGRIHVTYTWRRTRVRHVVLDPQKFQPRPIVGGAWPKP